MSVRKKGAMYRVLMHAIVCEEILPAELNRCISKLRIPDDFLRI